MFDVVNDNEAAGTAIQADALRRTLADAAHFLDLGAQAYRELGNSSRAGELARAARRAREHAGADAVRRHSVSDSSDVAAAAAKHTEIRALKERLNGSPVKD